VAVSASSQSKLRTKAHIRYLVTLTALLLAAALFAFTRHTSSGGLDIADVVEHVQHRAHVNWPCKPLRGLLPAISHTGFITLPDHDGSPRQSFYWLFQARQLGWEKAAIILTIGGGPGVSGLLYPFKGESHCVVNNKSEAVWNENAWSEKYNLLALDHPVGVGFSSGALLEPHTSHEAAKDVYSFLQGFFRTYPMLKGNPLVISSGSYGGIFVPHIADLIHRNNQDIPHGPDRINLKALMVSGALSDPMSRYAEMYEHRCDIIGGLYGRGICVKRKRLMPRCLELIRNAYSTREDQDKKNATAFCFYQDVIPWHQISLDDVAEECESGLDDGSESDCRYQSKWTDKFLRKPATQAKLGFREFYNYNSVDGVVMQSIIASGDEIAPHHLLYGPLLEAGIRILHYVGELDANCGWPGIHRFLKEIPWQLNVTFQNAPARNWLARGIVSLAGDAENRAGRLTFVRVSGAGHTVVAKRADVVNEMIKYFIENKPFPSLEAAE